MKKIPFYLVSLLGFCCLCFLFPANIFSQANIVASYKFAPKLNGFSFENFGNDNRNWHDDLGAEDLIKMFGAKAVCKVGNTPQNCVLKAAAREWMNQSLEGMNGGHCEGMAVTSLRFASGLPFKGRGYAGQFQTGISSPFGLKLDQPIENYIAYYFVTQGFDEVAKPSQETAKQGPLAVVKLLIESMNAGNDTYSLGFYKFKAGRKFDGHAITPFAVEDAGNVYRIHVYDNNYPGATRYVVVEKAGKQTWRYVTSTNPNEPAGEYVGNLDTKTLELTKTSLRDRGCFDAPFATESGAKDCVPTIEKPVAKPAIDTTKPAETKPVAPLPKPVIQNDGETVEFAINGEATMLISNAAGKRIGYDPKSKMFYNEIPGAELETVKGGMGVDMPHYMLPYTDDGKPYTITLSGDFLEEESNVDLAVSAPGFTIGFDGILLDPKEVVKTTVTLDGEQLSFTASADGETPEIYYAIDTEDESYFCEIDGITLDPGGTFSADFDEETGKLQFKDNDKSDDKFDVDFTRITSKGVVQNYETNDLGSDGTDSFEMEFGEWDGDGEMQFKTDDEGNGFEDDEEEAEPEEDNDADSPDDADDEDGDDGDDGDDGTQQSLLKYMFSF
ncbi:MAG: hypothetical protein H0U50_03135 [Pyrinomonadaceae bacterium]|nr:hypothetical protein [Pyrinomonadaceae bacterium]